jgi:hypothetical protein
MSRLEESVDTIPLTDDVVECRGTKRYCIITSHIMDCPILTNQRIQAAAFANWHDVLSGSHVGPIISVLGLLGNTARLACHHTLRSSSLN